MRLLRGVAFWLSVALALVYPVVFVASDIAWVDGATFFGIVVVHVVAVVIGHDYEPAQTE